MMFTNRCCWCWVSLRSTATYIKILFAFSTYRAGKLNQAVIQTEKYFLIKQKKGLQHKVPQALDFTGALDENRTRMALRPRDFKSLASTNSATHAPYF